MSKHFACKIIIAAIILAAPVCRAGEIDRIVSAGPSWERFTNKDGTGLYHEIIAEIFQPLGIRTSHQYTNANRGVHLVNKGLADVYLCRSDIDGFSGLKLADYPMYLGYFYAIFKTNRIPDWRGPSELEGRKVVWRRGYYRAAEFDTQFYILEADSGETALAQVILNRVVFYIDDLNLIKESISKIRLPMDPEDYDIQPVGHRSYRPVFKDSARGNRLMELFHRGMERLKRSGRLEAIFNKWDHPYPGDQFYSPQKK